MPPIAVRSSLTVLAALLLPPALAAQDGQRSLVLRSLAQFARARPQVTTALRSSLLPNEEGQLRALTLFGDDAEQLDVDGLLGTLHGEDRNSNRLEWSLIEAGLLLTGEPALVDNCDKQLDRLAAAFARPIAVTAWLLPPAGELPSVLDPQALAALLKERQPLWTQIARTQPFQPVTFADEQWIQYVRDIDVEVAEKSHIGDPKVDSAMAGLRLVCSVEPLPEGDQLVLGAALNYGERVAVRTVRTGVASLPDLDLPQWRTGLAQASARIQSGGGMVLQLRAQGDAGPTCCVLLTARFLAPPPPPVAADLMFVPIGALLHEPAAPLLPVLPQLPGMDTTTTEFRPGHPNQLDEGGLLEYLRHAAGDGLEVQLQAGFLVLRGPGAAQDRAMAALRQLVTTRLQNVEVVAETRGAPLAGSDGARPAGDEPLWKLLLPTLASRPCGGFVGTESSSIGDFEVEIASKSSISNPVVRVHQSGLWSAAWLRAQGPTLHADWTCIVASSGPVRLRPLGSDPDGHLGLCDLRVASFPLQGDVDPEQDIDLGNGPIVNVGDRLLRTRQHLRVQRR